MQIGSIEASSRRRQHFQMIKEKVGLITLRGTTKEWLTFMEEGEATILVQRLLGDMTIEEKVMQMAQVDKSYIHDKTDLATYGIGSVISGGSGQPFDNSPTGFADMVDDYQRHAMQSRLGIPLLYAGDAVHGMSLCKGTTIFPHNIGLGAAGMTTLVHEVARATAIETASTGVAWAFSPCVAVVDDSRWGRTYESFGSDPESVSLLGAAHIRGLQEDSEQAATAVVSGRGATVAACAKHFVGDGGVKLGTGRAPSSEGVKLLDRGDVVMEEAAFKETHLRPYVHAVKAGVRTVMVSFSSLNGEQMHAHSRMIQGVLRGELGFKGLVVSDWGGHNTLEVEGGPVEKLAICVNAGVDVIMVPDDYKTYRQNMLRAVDQGLISLARIDEAVSTILLLKAQLHLFSHPYADRSLLPLVRCPAHLALARRAVRRSLVYLRNQNDLLPLPRDLKGLHVSGRGAHDLGLQCGGWTASWQGARGRITEGTTILEALQQSLPPTCRITHSEDGSGIDPRHHQVALCCLAEDPYAEWFGDRQDLRLPPSEASVLQKVVGQGVPVVVVVLAGRPLVSDWAAVQGVVLAWLPGSEGQGVVDGLIDGAGRLPVAPLPCCTEDGRVVAPLKVGDGLRHGGGL